MLVYFEALVKTLVVLLHIYKIYFYKKIETDFLRNLFERSSGSMAKRKDQEMKKLIAKFDIKTDELNCNCKSRSYITLVRIMPG